MFALGSFSRSCRVIIGFLVPVASRYLFQTSEEYVESTGRLILSLQFIFETIFHTVRLLLAVFVFVASVVCFVLLKRSGGSRENVFGLAKMIVVTSILLVCQIFYAVYRNLEFRPTGYGFPFWFEYGVVLVGLPVITFAALLFLVVEATRILRLKQSNRYQELELESKEEKKEPLIPARYEI